MTVERWGSRRREASDGKPEVVYVRMLGCFSVSVGSRTLEGSIWRLKKAASLVKLLALSPERRLHRERLMGLLWPELDEKAAANNLRHVLYVARRILESNPNPASRYLQVQGEQIALCPEGPLRADVEAFEEAAATARRTRDPAAYRAAVELYAGDLLPGDLYEGWAEERRRELRGTYLALLLELAGLHEERGELEAAIEAFEGAVAEEPTREEAHAGLMRLYATSGRRRQALGQYERLSEALSGEIYPEPGAGVRRLYEEILAGSFPPTRPVSPPAREPTPTAGVERYPGRHNLPVSPSSFVGRERELVEVKRALAMTRLLTLTGAGGSGKTRLALAVTGDLAGAYPDGVWMVELAPLSEGRLVPKTVAEVLRVSEQAERPVTETLVDAMRNKEALILLDNCEHLIDACAGLVEMLLGSCPRLRVLATSREPLGIAGETNRLVPSLSLPDPRHPPTVEELAGCESARLFVERAACRSSDFALTPENAGAVAGICRQLDGIPLAIELAAARVGSLAVGQIHERLSDSLKLLTGGSRTATPRQRTLRGALDWGYELLEGPEKRLFCRVSVFAGGWTLEAAEAVGAGEGIEEGDVLDLVSRLVEKSLVVAGATPAGALRYRMLEPVRQYGRERLGESGETEAARRRHAAWYLALAEEAEPKLVGEEQSGWLERLETEHDNLRAALEQLLERGDAEKGLRLAGALGEFWRVRGHLGEGLRWLGVALANGEEEPPSSARVKALVHAGWMAWVRADFGQSTAFSEEALALSRRLGDKAGAATALFNLGMVAIYDRMRAEEARALFEESLALRRELGDETGASRTLQRLGLISVVRHDFGRAAALYEESLTLARRAGDKVAVAVSLWLGALVHLGLGDHRTVRAVAEEGFDLVRQTGHVHITALILNVLAASAGSQGEPVRSARLWGAAQTLRETIGVALGPAERYHYGPYIAAAREGLDSATWEAALAEGRTMTTEGAVEYALSEVEPATPAGPPGDAPPVKLTRREEEVAALVARRLSNRQIASALTISERTADKHVANVLKKLGLHSRHEVRDRLEERRPRGRH